MTPEQGKRNKMKNILNHKLVFAFLICFVLVLFSNLNSVYVSLLSLYYFTGGLFSGENLKSFIYDFLGFWIGSVFLLIGIAGFLFTTFKKTNCEKQIKSFFLKKTTHEFNNNKVFRYAVIVILLIVCIGFLAPFISPYEPDEISSVTVTKYLPPFSSAKYIIHTEISFDNSTFHYEAETPGYAQKLSEFKGELYPDKQKIYYDSLKIEEGSLILFQGNRNKTLPAYSISLETADVKSDFFLLGTDNYGRDVFSRMIFGTRVSLGVAVIATLISLILGIMFGLLSGYFQKSFDVILMRLTDIFLSFPVIFLLLLIVGLFGNSFLYIAIFIGLTTWMDVSRLTRAQVISVKNELFVTSVRALGFSSFRILYRHVLPNVITPIVINAAFRIGNIILMESALSFIGLGVNEPVSSWGSIINSGKDTLLNAWWISFFPGITITIVVILFNYIGDTFRRIVKIK
jgi:peptide/nickel transport system permease protein